MAAWVGFIAIRQMLWARALTYKMYALTGNLVAVPRISATESPDNELGGFQHPGTWYRGLGDPQTVLKSGLLLAGSLYGGIHLLAWNGSFPTRIERVFWGISCLIIAAASVGFAFIGPTGKDVYIVNELVHDLRRYNAIALFTWLLVKLGWRRYDFKSPVEVVFGDVLIVGTGTFAFAYVAARVCLIVECFINSAHLPDAAYQRPSWSKYIPHFGAR
jgi:hypothetical protein